MIAYILAPVFAFISSVVFVIPFEVVLLVLAGLDKVPVQIFGHHLDIAQYGTSFPWLLPFVAAVGSNLGSVLYYYMGAGSLRMSDKLKNKLDSFDFEKFDRARDAVVFFSSITSIPPVSLVAVASGVTRTNLTRYLYVSYFGKIVRYFLVIILGRFAIEAAVKWFG